MIDVLLGVVVGAVTGAAVAGVVHGWLARSHRKEASRATYTRWGRWDQLRGMSEHARQLPYRPNRRRR